uniref:Nucleoprotein n=1 Tax=Hymenopteran almendra-related virus OKIAV1 TaxID=2746366 RepID=A0A7D7EYG7_9RHAB|nr:nucleocapsid protein [Hymenopteran almendra-related virus OKIAV1]
MENKRILNIKLSNGREIKRALHRTVVEQPVEYPKEWFANNPQKKPTVRLDVGVNSENDSIYRTVGDGWESTLTLEDALAFLVSELSKMTIKLDSEWKSYGVLIGNKGEEVSPISLLNIERESERQITLSTSRIKNEEKLGRICELLSIYRIGRAEEQPGGYKEVVTSNIERVLRSDPFNIQEINRSGIESHLSWANDERFRKIVAATDMFMNKFTEMPYSKLRVCTLSSRMRDCGAYLAIRDFGRFLGMDELDAVSFFMDKNIGDELARITEEGEEYGVINSYFHYFRDFGLSKKSPYSSSANPTLYNFVYLTGSLLLNARSLNARLFSDNDITGLLNIAMYLTYVKANIVTPELISLIDKDKIKYEAFKAEMRDEEDDSASSLTPLGIYQSLQENDFTVPDHIKEFHKKRMSGLTGLRIGSVGLYIQKALQ